MRGAIASIPAPCRIGRVVGFLFSVLLLSGCIASRYRPARKGTPPPHLLNVGFTTSRLNATLNTVITYNGAGSWKRDAFWDEYVVSVKNTGSGTLRLTAAALTDVFGGDVAPRDHPWSLEKESKSLEQKYREAGIGFVRYTTPGLVILGSGAVAISGAGALTAAAATVVGVTIVALPIYYLEVASFNETNKQAMEQEFNRRRIALPLALAPGAAITGSFFFPMEPSPKSLHLHWTEGVGSGDAALDLGFLHDLHVTSPAPYNPTR